ncbi:MAG: alpha/beta hydrolase [Salibacteraceae bacterium]
MKSIHIFCFVLFIGLVSCEPDKNAMDDLLDGEIIFDASLYKPEEFLVSEKYPSPTASDLEKHILIAVHGYSASTFEWQEFQDWTDTTGNYRVSQVLLDGHGRTYDDFKNATWRDWKSAITREYEALEALGYTKISLVGSSTGGPLILEMVSSGYFQSHVNPKNIFLVDPIVVSAIKAQSVAEIIGPMLGYVTSDVDGDEKKYWYTYRPHETVTQLNTLMREVRGDLESGYNLPQDTYLKSYHSVNDPTASSASTVLIYKGLKTYTGNAIDAEIIPLDIHVFTRLELRENVTDEQRKYQLHAFEEMANRLNK